MFLRSLNFVELTMAVVLGNSARGLLGTLSRRAIGACLQNQVSTSAMLGQTSKSPSETNTKIYEMRTYSVKPKAFGKERKHLTLRFKPSKTP